MTGNFTKPFKEFVELCLNKDPNNRPSAKELLRHPFIRKARKTTYLQELIDKYQRWKQEKGNDSDSDSDSEEDVQEDEMQGDWIMTIKEADKELKEQLMNGNDQQRHPAPQPPQRPVSQYDVPRQSSSLSSTVVPLLLQLKDDYREDYRRRGHPVQRTEAVDELKNAFDLAERSCSGITDDLLTGVISRLATTATVSEVEIRRAIDKVKRPS